MSDSSVPPGDVPPEDVPPEDAGTPQKLVPGLREPASVGDARPPYRAAHAVRVALYLCLAGAIGAVAYAGYQAAQDKSVMRHSQDRLVDHIGLKPLAIRPLAPNYSDKNGRLLADPPADPKLLLNPDTLVLAHDEDSDADVQATDWDGFAKFLSKITGKKVESREYTNTVEEIASVEEGKIQIVALHGADTPFLVNNAGFIPIAVLAGESGANGNHLDLAVRPDSNLQKLADLEGHTLTCATPVSITGYRAAVEILQEDAGMRPEVDYFINFSLSMKRSVLGLADGTFEVAALSDDKVQSLLNKEKIKQSDFRIIYQSQVIPRLTIGYVYNLQPELAAKVKQAVLEFKNEGGAVEEASGKPMHFVGVDYKKDFDFMRKIDGSFDPRLGAKAAKAKAGIPPAPPAKKEKD